MGSYGQWRIAADRGEVRRVTWVCGDQRVLAEEVVDTIRYLLKVTPAGTVTLHGGAVPDREVWAAAAQLPLDPDSNRLVLVRDAQRIKHFGPLTGWLAAARQLPNTYLLFVSGDVASPAGGQVPADVLKPPRAHIVRCVLPGPAEARAWVRRRAQLDDRTADHLLTRSGGDLAVAAAVCAKLALFGGAAGISSVDQLCQDQPADTFVEHLLSLDKPHALQAQQTLTVQDYRCAVGLLDSRLDSLHLLHRALHTRRDGHRLREVPGVSYFLVRQYQSIAKHYDQAAVDRRRNLLTLTDIALRHGARIGVLEALVLLW